MNQSSTARVFLSEKAYRQIKDSVANAENNFEVGGILLGYKFLNNYYIVSVTVPCEKAEKSKVSFTLDGEWHMSRVSELKREFKCKPFILGIWHSHICDVDLFSEQDRQSNKQFAISFNRALSMIAIWSIPSLKLNLTVYSISPDGEEKLCKIATDITKLLNERI